MTSLVDIQVEDCSSQIPEKRQICEWIDTVFSILGRPPLDLTVRIVSEEEMKELNRRYRGRDHPTNVLSFPFEPVPNVKLDLLGDIIVCGSVVAREAMTEQQSLLGHWAHMIVHGMLHLLDYDHESDHEAEIMESIEERLLRRLGFSDLYN